jgi:hypothetical protein
MEDLESMVLVRLSISGSDSSSRIELRLPCLTSLVSLPKSRIELKLPCLLSLPDAVGVSGLKDGAGGCGSGFSRLFCRLSFRACCEDWPELDENCAEGRVGVTDGLSVDGVKVVVLELELEEKAFRAPSRDGARERLKESSRVGMARLTPL